MISFTATSLVCLSVYLDQSKAFDIVNHDMLLKNLNYYCVRGAPLRWLKSQLSQRMHYVSYKGVESEHYDVSSGVPQASVLSPLLSVIYSNDIPNIIAQSKSLLYIALVRTCISCKYKWTKNLFNSITGSEKTNHLLIHQRQHLC